MFWQRNFRLFWIGEAISGVSTSAAVVGIPLLAVQALHASTFAVSALVAAANVPWLIVGLPAGAWVDRLASRSLMIICDIISAVLFASLPVAAWLHVLTIGQVIAVVLLAGTAAVFFTPALQVFLPVGVLLAAAGAGGLLGALVARWVAPALGTARALIASVLGSGACGLLIPLTSRTRCGSCSIVHASAGLFLLFSGIGHEKELPRGGAARHGN